MYKSSNLSEMMKTNGCGKMVVLEKLIRQWGKKNEKALIFSRSTQLLNILQMVIYIKNNSTI